MAFRHPDTRYSMGLLDAGDQEEETPAKYARCTAPAADTGLKVARSRGCRSLARPSSFQDIAKRFKAKVCV